MRHYLIIQKNAGNGWEKDGSAITDLSILHDDLDSDARHNAGVAYRAIDRHTHEIVIPAIVYVEIVETEKTTIKW